MSGADRLVEKIAVADSQETLVLGATQDSQRYDLEDGEVERVNAALAARPRIRSVRVGSHATFSPTGTDAFLRTCVEHKGIRTVQCFVYSRMRSNTQRNPMQVLEDAPDMADAWINNHPDTKRYNLFALLNARRFKTITEQTVDGAPRITTIEYRLPEDVLNDVLQPFLRPVKQLVLEPPLPPALAEADDSTQPPAKRARPSA